MYRQQNYESRVVDYHEDAPFFREAVALIDQCTKLPKDDRIALRNKIKDYLRTLRESRTSENQDELEQFKQIVQIFVEANKKKSLSKIQKGDRVMDWLQIRLRKFMDYNKKQKHRRELQNFRRDKVLDFKKHPQGLRQKTGSSIRPPNHHQVLGVSRNNQQSSHISYYLQPNSLSRSREKSPIQTSRKSSQSQSYAQYSYHKNFSFLKRRRDADQASKDCSLWVPDQKDISRVKQLDKQIQQLHRSVDQLGKAHNYSTKSKLKNSRNKNDLLVIGSRGNQFKRPELKGKIKNDHGSKSKGQTKKEINQLTKLFTQQLNAPPSFAPCTPQQLFTSPTFNFQILPQEKPNSYPIMPLEQSQIQAAPNTGLWGGYEQSTKKIQSMLESSRQIYDQISGKFEMSSTTSKGTVALPNVQQSSVQDIFTPPDFLAECRKLISSSSKKPAVDESILDIEHPHLTKLTFNNILTESREKRPAQVGRLGTMGINEVISENASIDISTKKPESQVQFQFKTATIQSIEQLLLEIFRENHFVSLNRYQIGEVMSNCAPEVQGLLQQYCDTVSEELENTQLPLKFVAFLKFFYTRGKVFTETESYFANFLCSILDMRKVGYVDQEAVDEFLESMEGSGIEEQLLREISELLTSVFRRSCDVQGGGAIVTRWSLFYLQLKRDVQMMTLKELLGRFQFQIDPEE